MKTSLFRRVLNVLLRAAAIVAFFLIVGVGYLVWPREYPRNYLQTAAGREARGLARAANAEGNATRLEPFYVGTIGVPERLAELEPLLPHDFNSVTAENAMKWPQLLRDGRLGVSGAPVYDFAAADRLVDFCLAKGVRVRGHNLVWGRFLGDGFIADVEARLQASAEPKEAMRQILRDHIRTVMTHFRGRVREWDVLNEPLQIFGAELDATLWQRTLGDGYIAELFHLAHAVDPEAVLVLNEQLNDYTDAHAERLLTLLEELVRQKVPVHVLGVQSHVLVRPPSPQSLQAFLRRVTALGLKFELTEVDVRLRAFSDAPDPYEAQGVYVGELIRTAAAFPECRGITFWGVSDRYNWMDDMPPFRFMKPNEPHLFDVDGVRKPAYWATERALTEARKSL